MIAFLMGILDRVVLRALTCGLWMILISYELAERSDPLLDARGENTLSLLASWLSVATGVAWLVMAILITARRGIGTRTWTRSEHVAGVGLSILFLGASLATLSPVFSVIAVCAVVCSSMDLIDVDHARDLVDNLGVVEAAAEFEDEAGSRRAATRKALALLTVRDEVGDQLAEEVLCGIPVPKGDER